MLKRIQATADFVPGYARSILKKPVGRVYVIAQRRELDGNTLK